MELSLQVQQKQILSQKMQQSVEILQMNAVTLSEYIREFAEENPLVEWNEEKEPVQQENTELLQKLEDLQRIPLTFTAAEGFDSLRRYFISDDEINQALRGHESEFRSRLDVFSFFIRNTDAKEREKFLKRQHGEYSGYHGGNDNRVYDSTGFFFSHGSIGAPYAQVNMKWPAVTKWVSNMISAGVYLYPSDTDKMADYEINQLARQIMSFFSNAPDGFQRPTPRSDFDYWEGVAEIQEQLSAPEQKAEKEEGGSIIIVIVSNAHPIPHYSETKIISL